MNKLKNGAVIAVLPLALVLTGCSSGTPDDLVKQFDETATWGTGISITVTTPELFTATGISAGPQSCVSTMTMTNDSDEDFFNYVEVDVDGEEAIFDSGNPIGFVGRRPVEMLKAGSSLSWLEGYTCSDPNNVTLTTTPVDGYDAATFTLEK